MAGRTLAQGNVWVHLLNEPLGVLPGGAIDKFRHTLRLYVRSRVLA